jgi:transposase
MRNNTCITQREDGPMPTQLHLPVQPAGAREINAVVAMLAREDQVAYFASGVPLFVHRAADPVGRRVAAVQMMELGLARQDELSAALGVNRTTLYRQQRKLQRHGVLGVVDGKRGPRGPHRFTAEKVQRVAELLEAGQSIRQAAAQVGVTEGTVRHALRRGERRRASTVPAGGLGPRSRSEQAARGAGGVAVQRHTERALARLGQLMEAAPQFVAAEAVRGGGALLALPAVLALGLLDAGQQAYGALKHGFYGLQATLLCLTFMAPLRIRTPEQLQGQPPGELGLLLGLDLRPGLRPCPTACRSRPSCRRARSSSWRPKPSI